MDFPPNNLKSDCCTIHRTALETTSTKFRKMQNRYGNDPHSFTLQPRSNNTEEADESKSPTGSEKLEYEEEIIAEAFARDGFFVLRQCFDKNVLLPFRDFANAYFDKCFQDLFENGHIEVPSYRYREILSNVSNNTEKDTDALNKQFRPRYTLQKGVKHGFREIVMRSPGRYEVSLQYFDQNDTETMFHTYQLDENIPLLVEPLKSLLPRLVGPNYNDYEDLKLCGLSLLIATPGSSDQSWHADGCHVNLSKHLPCHVFNIFFPLQDTPHILGPTEIRPASQFLTRNLGPMMLAAKCRKTLRRPVWPELAFGDAIVLDYRVLHRGRANVSGDSAGTSEITTKTNNNEFKLMNRNYLVLCYSEPWFHDIINFPKRSMYDTKHEEN